MTRRSALSKLFAAVTVVAALGLGSAALAAANPTGSVGGVATQDAACWGDRIVVGAPQFGPAPQYLPPNVGYSSGNSQVVSFRSSLARWYPGTGWLTVKYGTWQMTRVSDTALGEGYRWTTLDGKQAWGQETFLIQPRAYNAPKVYFRVYTEYKWHADSTHLGGSWWSWNLHRENRGNQQQSQAPWNWCEYPGPNGIVITG